MLTLTERPPIAPNAPASDRAERLRAMYREHAPAVRGFLLRQSRGERENAEDALQETFARAWRSIDHLTGDVRPWLITVARRVWIDMIRARRCRPAEVGDLDVDLMPASGDAFDHALTARVVRDALGALDEAHRRVLFELYLRGRTVAEVARLLGIPEGTVKSRSFNALRSLRKQAAL